MIIPEEREYPESSPQEYNAVNGKNLAGPVDVAAESDFKGHINTHILDDGGSMVRELTLNNFDGGSFIVVGSSNDGNRKPNNRQGSGNEGFVDGNVDRATCPVNDSILEETGYSSLSDFLTQKQCNDDFSVTAHLSNTGSTVGAGSMSSPGGIRTKILSKSGISQFFC